MAGFAYSGHTGLWEGHAHGWHSGCEGKGSSDSRASRFVESFSLLLPWKSVCNRTVSSRDRRPWEGLFLRGGRFSKEGSGLLGSASPGAQALECYSCVQKADDGCSPHKMKTVKCAPGVDVCTEAVGAVETSEWGPRATHTNGGSSGPAQPPYSRFWIGHAPLTRPHPLPFSLSRTLRHSFAPPPRPGLLY